MTQRVVLDTPVIGKGSNSSVSAAATAAVVAAAAAAVVAATAAAVVAAAAAFVVGSAVVAVLAATGPYNIAAFQLNILCCLSTPYVYLHTTFTTASLKSCTYILL